MRLIINAHASNLLRVVSAVLLLSGYAAAGSAQVAPWPTKGWAVASPEDQGIDGAPLRTLSDSIRVGAFGHIDRLVVVRHGFLVMSERYPQDYREIGRNFRSPLGCGVDACTDSTEIHQYNYVHPDFHPYHGGRDVHSLQSVTKSVTSALIGIAIGRGEIEGVDVPLLGFFDDYDLSRVDPRLRTATLDDLLTMRTGIEWHETDRPLDETNTTLQLEYSDDWIQFTLDQPMDTAPGEKWVYNSGGSHLMSGVIKRATGHYVDEYAEAHLFGPLGIGEYHWKLTPTRYPDTEGGLYLEAEQLAKIGLLYLRDGEWDGTRILPEGWVRASTARHVDRVGIADWGYGYQWWRLDQGTTEVWAGLGFGGQYLLILPQHDVVGVINSWNVIGDNQAAVLGPFLRVLFQAVAAPAR